MQRFQDLSKLVILESVVDFSTIDSTSASIDLHLQESPINPQTDKKMKVHFITRGIESFWAEICKNSQYSNICEQVKLFFAAFPLSYMVEI